MERFLAASAFPKRHSGNFYCSKSRMTPSRVILYFISSEWNPDPGDSCGSGSFLFHVLEWFKTFQAVIKTHRRTEQACKKKKKKKRSCEKFLTILNRKIKEGKKWRKLEKNVPSLLELGTTGYLRYRRPKLLLSYFISLLEKFKKINKNEAYFYKLFQNVSFYVLREVVP